MGLLRLPAVVALTGMLALAPDLAAAVGPTVTRQGFCVTRSETGCSELALPGTMLDIARLPRRADGTRTIAFFSVQDVPAKGAIVHMLEAEDAEPQVDAVVGDAGGGKADDLMRALKALGAKAKGLGAVVLTAFRPAPDRAEPYRVFSEIAVRGPGLFHGRVVDLKGNPIPGSEPVTFGVVLEPR